MHLKVEAFGARPKRRDQTRKEMQVEKGRDLL
jgi:hypothetical protein